ncbi:MAG: vWA domain-containing protein [Desulfatibacillaceae bacterium]
MANQGKRQGVLLGILVLVTCAALGLARVAPGNPGGHAGSGSGIRDGQGSVQDPPPTGDVTVSARLLQDMVYAMGDRVVPVELTIMAGPSPETGGTVGRNVDMVIVMDRSGSMGGTKIRDAREAAKRLLDELGDRDRFALVSYSSDVRTDAKLVNVDGGHRPMLENAVRNIRAGGGTNLGGGLDVAIRLLENTPRTGNTAKIVLISDGHANEGVVHPVALGEMASRALPGEFAVSTVGVGTDFNEVLMTTIADRGAGTYHFLDDPGLFASVFMEELGASRAVAASSLEVRLPLPPGALVREASGYPVTMEGNVAVFHPGEVYHGRSRRLFVRVALPGTDADSFDLSGIELAWKDKGVARTARAPEKLVVACVDDEDEARASVDLEVRERLGYQEGLNRMREEVAGFIRSGDRDAAQASIREYAEKQIALTRQVRGAPAAARLESEVDGLRDMVDSTFAGSAPEVAKKRKANSLDINNRAYKGRRDKAFDK